MSYWIPDPIASGLTLAAVSGVAGDPIGQYGLPIAVVLVLGGVVRALFNRMTSNREKQSQLVVAAHDARIKRLETELEWQRERANRLEGELRQNNSELLKSSKDLRDNTLRDLQDTIARLASVILPRDGSR